MSEESSGGSVARFIGLGIVAVAVLWMAFSGLCAATMVYGMISESQFDANAAGWTFFIVVISGISAAMGYALFVVGRGLSRHK